MMRVLLVEDDGMIGASVQKGLRQDGFSVDWVRDGQAAEAALAAHAYDVVLLDLRAGRAGLKNISEEEGESGRRGTRAGRFHLRTLFRAPYRRNV